MALHRIGQICQTAIFRFPFAFLFFLREGGSFDAEIEIPLDLFSSKNISFTYPDSFFSEWLSRNKDHELYDNELNGKIFTMDEVFDLLTQNKIPEGAQMDTSYGYKFDFYIEAQVWDYDILNNYMIGQHG